MRRVIVVGLGPAGPELLTEQVRSAIRRTSRRFVRTNRHLAAEAVAPFESFDHVYEQAASLEEVYHTIVERLLAASEDEEVLYAVPGSPLVAERTVELLRVQAGLAQGDLELEVLAGLSFWELAWERLGIDPLAAGVRLVDGYRFSTEAAGERGPLLVVQCDNAVVLSEVKLALLACQQRFTDTEKSSQANQKLVVLQRLGLADEQVLEVDCEDLDRVVTPDHLTSLYVPALAAPMAQEMARFAELAVVLREQCPWDREQTHQSLRGHLLEETYEVLEALDAVNPETLSGYEDLEEELGDLLYQIVFHALLAAEAGQFSMADVVQGIHDKLMARHPHIFGSATEVGSHDVRGVQAGVDWEALKRQQKGRASVMEGIPVGLPALLFADKVIHKARSVGLEPNVDTATIAGRLYDAVLAAQAQGLDAESELRVFANSVGEQIRRCEIS
ncbi:MAG: nucleotide pyrophosphohydrolase [Acidimicrobiia bacterium]|nr:nucleotide pyrophosphohydrolase [Acidimicrobiia bacterium]